MSVQVEKLENNMAKLTIQVGQDVLDKAMNDVYLKARNRISVPGFRKGKAPRFMIEKAYGKGIFLEDAVNEILPSEYSKAVEESGLDIVSRPNIEVTQLEPDKDLIFTAEVALRPPVTLGEYKGLEVKKQEVSVTDDEVEAVLKREQEKNARIVPVEDRPAAMDDIVTLDFEGFMDGVAFEGGKGTDHRLTLGSHSFIPGFEEKLVGAKVGEHLEIEVTFPEEYHEKSLAGRPAVFSCDIKKIETKELPELNDELAQDVAGVDTLDEYRQNVRADLLKQKEDAPRREKENEAVDKAAENATIDVPDAMIETEARNMLEEFEQRMGMQGLNMKQYYQYTGQTEEKMLEDYKPGALKRIRTRLVLEKIAAVEEIAVSEEEIAEEIKKMAEAYSMEVSKLEESIGENGRKQLSEDLAVQKAITLITDAAKEV